MENHVAGLGHVSGKQPTYEYDPMAPSPTALPNLVDPVRAKGGGATTLLSTDVEPYWGVDFQMLDGIAMRGPSSLHNCLRNITCSVPS